MSESYTLKTAPAAEPVTLAEVKTHLRVDGTDYDTTLTPLIETARQQVEEYTWRALITQTWEKRMDAFLDSAEIIALSRPPILSIESFKYFDPEGVQQTLTAPDYQLDIKSEPGRVMPAYGASWPDTRDLLNAITIEFKAGYGAATTDVPQAIRQAIKMLVSHLYENPAPFSGTQDIPGLIKNILLPYRVTRFF